MTNESLDSEESRVLYETILKYLREMTAIVVDDAEFIPTAKDMLGLVVHSGWVSPTELRTQMAKINMNLYTEQNTVKSLKSLINDQAIAISAIKKENSDLHAELNEIKTPPKLARGGYVPPTHLSPQGKLVIGPAAGAYSSPPAPPPPAPESVANMVSKSHDLIKKSTPFKVDKLSVTRLDQNGVPIGESFDVTSIKNFSPGS